MENLITIFTYGSLKAGYRLHYLLEYYPYLGKATTGPEYTLLDGPYFPFMVEREGIGARGELYKVPKGTVMQLDMVEGHPHFYERKTIKVLDENGDSIEVQAYIHPDDLRMKQLVEIFEWER